MKAILTKRLSGTPLPYIIGNSYFYSREFLVTPDVLIPRPDTETLIELVLMHESKSESIFADIGLGSGIISCILTETVPLWKAVGVDISYPALKVAQKNCHTPVMLLCADMLSAFKPGKTFDFIVSNPPYISQDEMDTLDPEVRNFEPVTALCGGSDGLDFYRYLALESKKVLKKTGRIYCEIGYNQQISVFDIFSNQGWSKIKTEKDLGGNPRVLMAELQD
jgi:release factor glutamine methyltransferase